MRLRSRPSRLSADFRNDATFERETEEARAFGFQGKLCIHPRQVELANAGFAPSPKEVDHARRLLEAYTRESAAGVGAIEFEGQMVDEPLAARARQILAAARAGPAVAIEDEGKT